MRLKNIIILLAVLVVLGGVYLIVSQPEAEDSTEPTVYIWTISADEMEYIEVSLPQQDMSQAFIKISDDESYVWYFDDEERSEIDPERWGGGITLLLEGPGAGRVINTDATDEQLATYGLAEPSMIITLILSDEHTMVINFGDSTLNGNYYVQAPGTNAVATVDYTWYDVLERLVTEPPYVTAEE